MEYEFNAPHTVIEWAKQMTQKAFEEGEITDVDYDNIVGFISGEEGNWREDVNKELRFVMSILDLVLIAIRRKSKKENGE